jgi:3-hydroxyisobutyrate dehydrogenase-like beta-hydroxyacid dehydrogenase
MALYTVGFLGAGRIGAPMVERLLAAGHRVLLHVRRPGVRTRLGALGADLVGDPVDLATADVVVSCLFDDTQLLAVAPPIVAALGVDAAFVSHTTGSPAVLDQLASGGTTVVDAPFSGDADAVSAGRLTVFLGAPPPRSTTC